MKNTEPYSRTLLIAIVLTLCLFFLRFGYDFGVSDQGEFLPQVLNRLRPELLSYDWFVSLQNQQLNVRSGFVTVLLVIAHLMPLWLAVLCLYVAAAVLCISAVFRLAFLFSGSVIPAFAATVVSLVLTPDWSLGGNEVLTGMLTPSMVAWGLCLWGLVSLVEDRTIRSGLLLGVAAVFQPLVALQFFLLALICLMVMNARSTGYTGLLSATARLTGPFLVASGWLLIPMIVSQLQSSSGGDATEILTHFRAPHHYLPHSFPGLDYLKFCALVAVGLPALASVLDSDEDRTGTIIRIILISIGVLLAISLVGIYVLDSGLIVKLQLFKLTVLAKVLLVIGVTAFVWRKLPQTMADRLMAFASSPFSTFAAALFVGLTIAGVLGIDALHARALPFATRDGGAEGEMIRWVRSQTVRDGRFAIPPSLSGFRYRAERSIFVDFKAIPFNDNDLIEWKRRLMLEAPLADTNVGGTAALGELDKAYEAMSVTSIGNLTDAEDISYVLRRTPLALPPEEHDFSLVFQNSEWYVYFAHETELSIP